MTEFIPDRKCLLCQEAIPGGTGMFLCDDHWKEVPTNLQGFFFDALKDRQKQKATDMALFILKDLRDKHPEFKKEIK